MYFTVLLVERLVNGLNIFITLPARNCILNKYFGLQVPGASNIYHTGTKNLHIKMKQLTALLLHIYYHNHARSNGESYAVTGNWWLSAKLTFNCACYLLTKLNWDCPVTLTRPQAFNLHEIIRLLYCS